MTSPRTECPQPGHSTSWSKGRVALAILLCLALARLLFLSARFALQSLQMDFAAYYIAGQAVDLGLTPYVNHVDHVPPLWDGVARYAHSRFLYPPLAAYLFVPLARLPYLTAKSLWTLLGLICTGASLIITARAIRPARLGPTDWMVVGLGTALFHPLLTHLERGQIDSLTMMLLVASIALMLPHGRASRLPPGLYDVAAGLLLALATLLKLHVGLILPFLLVRRRFATSIAYAAGLALIVIVSIRVAPHLSRDYGQRELPRISTFGEGGTEDMLLDPARLEPLVAGLPEWQTRLAGAEGTGTLVTLREYFPFVSNGTLVREVMRTVEQRRLPISISQLSMGLFGMLFGVFVFWQRLNAGICGSAQRARTTPGNPVAEFLTWSMTLIIIMLAAPATWVMNLVWLLPLGVVFVVEARRVTGEAPLILPTIGMLMMGFTGLALAALPDRIVSPWDASVAYRISDEILYPWGWLWASRKYLIAQGMLLVSIAGYVMATLGSPEPADRQQLKTPWHSEDLGKRSPSLRVRPGNAGPIG